jgi:hypothetical protein
MQAHRPPACLPCPCLSLQVTTLEIFPMDDSEVAY